MLHVSVLVVVMVLVEPGPVFVIVCADAMPVMPKQAIVTAVAYDDARRSHAVLAIFPSLVNPYKSASLTIRLC